MGYVFLLFGRFYGYFVLKDKKSMARVNKPYLTIGDISLPSEAPSPAKAEAKKVRGSRCAKRKEVAREPLLCRLFVQPNTIGL